MKTLILFLFFSISFFITEERDWYWWHSVQPDSVRTRTEALSKEPILCDVLEVNYCPDDWASYLTEVNLFALTKDKSGQYYPTRINNDTEYVVVGFSGNKLFDFSLVKKTQRGYEYEYPSEQIGYKGRTLIAKRFYVTRTKYNRARAFQDAAFDRDMKKKEFSR